ncbi:schwannomin-interacting protein 1 isoform X2 [Kryptolebias marmoratus]|uniref:schwannomin-interacting protein 1 isoform X2 n=1 Tax=Kryptolebias marmoratus TaxID=37003 RepID=UPI0018ACB655|nr:schwannomin-interacting protein 1 isoform X2 [Kryptolebias marmoratus]
MSGRMEGDNETAEEEEEEEELHHHIAAASSTENLPIMHWEDLSERIAELERQEEERRERRGTGDSQGRNWTVWEEEEEDFRCRVAVFTSRFQNHRKLQLCFINDSDSEEEEEGGRKVSRGPRHGGCRGAGLKQEVAAALRALRDKLLAEQKEEEEERRACSSSSSSCVSPRKHLEHQELQELPVQQLLAVRASLQQEVHALSSELVAHLLVRDQRRTKQDAMLLDVQDLT